MGDGRRVALVTGTSRGLGEAVARRLIAGGDLVVGVSRGGSPELCGEAFVDVRADLGDPEQCVAVVEDVLAGQGRIDVLVNNAATSMYAPCWELAPEQLDELLRVNLTAPFLLSREVLRRWVGTGTVGTIVTICSIESEVAWDVPPQAGYALTKGGLVGLTRALAYDHGHLGIRVNGVAPGIMRTALSPLDHDLGARVPLQGRLAEPEEIAEVVAFVASPEASYMTGEIVFADGGYRLP